MSKAIRLRLRRMRKAASVVAAPTPPEVSKAMRHHAETGEWPEGIRPKVQEMAELLQGGAAAISATIPEVD